MIHFRTDPANYHESPEALLQGFRDILAEKVAPHLLELFHSLPEAELIIRPVEESMKDGPAAFYLAGSLDGTRPGKSTRLWENYYKTPNDGRYV